MKRIASSRLSAEAQAIMDAQTDIKQFVKTQYMKGVRWQAMRKELDKKIQSYVDEIELPQLKEQTKKSLYAMAVRIYRILDTTPVFGSVLLLQAVLLLAKNKRLTPPQRLQAEKIVMSQSYKTTTKDGIQTKYYDDAYWIDKRYYGTKVQLRVKEYMKDVTETVRRLARERAIDEYDDRDVYARNSLRWSAEIQVRQANHEREIAEIKATGNNLVICSTHADCSDRCYPWQGRVYSLDGTSGRTDDGRKYVPLETATDIYYTTHAGRTYKNGLLGFNCRHRLIPYMNGRKPPMVSKQEQQREKKIDQTQRAYERAVVRAREKAIAFKGIDNELYERAKEKAAEIYEKYKNYSHNHGRSYYESRVRIL